jgi:hypothetical protein
VRDGDHRPPAGWDLPAPPPWEEVIHQRWDLGRVLPWDHLQGPLPKGTLAKHHQEALNITDPAPAPTALS